MASIKEEFVGKYNLLKKQRKILRSRVTRKTNVEFDSLEELDKLTLLESLIDLKSELKVVQSSMLSIELSSDMAEDQINEIELRNEEYMDRLSKNICILRKSPVDRQLDNSMFNNVDHNERSKLKLTLVDLPTYDRNRDEFEPFVSLFEEIVSHAGVSNYEKFVLFRNQLRGDARHLIDSLAPADHNFDSAKSLLEDAFASGTRQKRDVIARLNRLKLNQSDDPYQFVGEFRSVRERLKQLNVTVDDVTEFFFWKALNENMKTEFVHLCNSAEPSLEDMEEKLFEAVNRYQISVKSTINKKLETVDVECKAVNVQSVGTPNSKKCGLCGSNDHFPSKCDKYTTAHSKICKIKDLGGCVKCARLNHDISNCFAKLKYNCINCKGDHVNFLCRMPVPDEENKRFQTTPDNAGQNSVRRSEQFSKGTNRNFDGRHKVKNKFSSALSNFHISTGEILDSSILPTFTSCINDSNRPVRMLLDSGSQTNLILSSLAEELKLPSVKSNVQIGLNGINSSKNFETKIVEFFLTVDGRNVPFRAVCVPEINIYMEVEGMGEIVANLKDRLVLADKFLTEDTRTISDVGVILGTEAFSALKCSFSMIDDCAASVVNSCFGAMLLGNLKRLNECSNFSKKISSYSIAARENEKSLNELTFEEEKSKETEVVFETDLNGVYCPKSVLQFDEFDEARVSEVNQQIIDFVLESMDRTDDGRLIVPLIWRPNVAHLLGKNFHLAKKILLGSLNKDSNHEKLLMIDETFKEQEKLKIIERVENFEAFMLEHPEASFLAHRPIFKFDRETTKVRVVFMSNLVQKSGKKVSLSHNQAMLSGPNLNPKLSVNLTMLRFDRYLLLFDIRKAFLNLELREEDQNRLLFLWFRSVKDRNYEIICYRNLRLSFGLKCSPTLLMLALYKLLILDSQSDSCKLKDLKRLIFQLFYMDNGGISANAVEDIKYAYQMLEQIFSPYKLEIQQIACNEPNVQLSADANLSVEPRENEKLLGMVWKKSEDTISCRSVCLDETAKTKRQVLSSINSVFDPLGINIPFLNEAKLFLHRLQEDKELKWDLELSDERLNAWKRICKKVNNLTDIEIPRFVGERKDPYRLVCFSDSSKLMYGAVVYLQDIKSGRVTFLQARNRIITKSLRDKSMPSLELHALVFATEFLSEIKADLTGSDTLCPVNIVDCVLLTDSLVIISWIKSYFLKLDKMNDKSVFVLNRLHNLEGVTRKISVTVSFVAGAENPADMLTREVSYRTLIKSQYFHGAKILEELGLKYLHNKPYTVSIPNPDFVNIQESLVVQSDPNFSPRPMSDRLIPAERFSDLSKLTKTYVYILMFINKLKNGLREKDSRYEHLTIVPENSLKEKAFKLMVLKEQLSSFPDLFNYFVGCSGKSKMPKLIKKLNIFCDKEGLLRVRSKFKDPHGCSQFPLLLPKHNYLSKLIVRSIHEDFYHAGCYTVLSHLRKRFWILNFYSLVRSVLKECLVCKRHNGKTVELNQNYYRERQVCPPKLPFRFMYLDYLGPFNIKTGNSKVKVWLLIFTCVWSRAINLKICHNLTVQEFLRVLQVHIYEFGMSELIVSDLGSQITAGAKTVHTLLNDPVSSSYFRDNNMKIPSFEQYFKGCPKLGGLVESTVKLTKKLIYGGIRNNVLNLLDFELLVAKVNNLLNKRPIAFLEGLRESKELIELDFISPEVVLRGYETIICNVVPHLQDLDCSDVAWVSDPLKDINSNNLNLRKCHKRILDLYHSEYLAKLAMQATDRELYRPVAHSPLEEGDIVLLKEDYCKASHYPMAVIKKSLQK